MPPRISAHDDFDPEEKYDAMDEKKVELSLGGEGNINSPPSAKKQANAYVFWFVVLKSSESSNSSLTSWIKKHCRDAIWQLERGSTETHYEHYQLHLHLEKKQRLTWMKKHFNGCAYLAPTRSITAGMNYSDKSETRIDGPWYWPEPLTKIKDPMEGLQLKWWQTEINEILDQPPHSRHVYWYWSDKGDVGKSTFVKHLLIKRGACVIGCGASKDIAHSIPANPKIILLDVARSAQNVPYTSIENVKNGLVFSGKYESQTKLFDTTHIIIFANYEPNRDKLSSDRWIINNIDEAQREIMLE